VWVFELCETSRIFGRPGGTWFLFFKSRRGIHDPFPLILTFSRREKEQPLASFIKLASHQAEPGFIFARSGYES
jgi:hypothetical protein